MQSVYYKNFSYLLMHTSSGQITLCCVIKLFLNDTYKLCLYWVLIIIITFKEKCAEILLYDSSHLFLFNT